MNHSIEQDSPTSQVPAIVSMFAQDDMTRRRGKQKGYLRREYCSWVGYWNEIIRGIDGVERWHKFSRVIGPTTWTKKQAQKEFDRVILDKLEGANQCPQSLATFKQFAEQKFIPDVVDHLDGGYSKRQYKSILKVHLMPELGEKRLRDIRREHVQAIIWKTADNKKSPETVRHVKKVASALFNYAISIEYYVGINPASKLRLPAIVKVKPNQAYTPEQMRMILDAMKSPEKEASMIASLLSLNRSELQGLRWKRLNLTAQFKTVEGELLKPFAMAVREHFYEGKYGPLKANSRRRDLPIPGSLVTLLQDLKANSKFTKEDDPVFCSRNGTPLDLHNVSNRQFKDISKKLGFTVNWHSFRHTASTWSEAVGMPGSDRIALMGHSTAAMTQRYTHEDLTRQREYVEKMANLTVPKVVEITKQRA